MRRLLLLGCAIVAIFSWAAQPGAKDRRGNPVFVPVKPVVNKQTPPAANLSIGSGQFFTYALPAGWRVGEDGQFALTLVAPDSKAFTVMVGNAGFPPNYPPGRFIYEKLMAMQPQNLKVGPPRSARPVAGFSQAAEFDVSYAVRGIGYRGIAKCNIQTAYDTAVMAMTAAISEANQWPNYATWLPPVADQISAANGAAFGVRGLMAQNLRNSTAYAEAARSYRDWSQKNWQQVTNDRNASNDRNNTAFRETLGGVQPYTNPYGEDRKVELPLTYQHYWMDRQGNVVGTHDPNANPNQGSNTEWRSMNRAK